MLLCIAAPCLLTLPFCAILLGQDAQRERPEQTIFSQDVDPKPKRFQRIAVPAIRLRQGMNAIELSKLVRAKISGGEEAKIIMMMESYRKGKADQAVTRTRQEQRTRTVMVNGKPVEQSYIVSVPYIETIKGADVLIPAGIKMQVFDVADFDFYDLAGEAVSLDEAGKRLNKLTPVFLLDNFNSLPKGLPEVQQQAFVESCLIVTTSKTIRNK